MKSLKSIAGYNLLAILAYSVLIRLAAGGDMGILIISAFAVGLHVVTALVISGFYASDKKKEEARAWLLTALLVLLVGFSTCLGNAAL